MLGPWEIYLRNATFTHSNKCNLYRKIRSYFEAGKFTDVTVTSSVDGREFKCHALILAAACEYFHTMFRGDWREKREKTINFSDVDGATLNLLLQFAYQATIVLDDENIYAALCISDRFGVPTLEHMCVRYLTERNIPTNCAIELFTFACAANKTSLVSLLRDFILNHLLKLWNDAGRNMLLKMHLGNLKTLLANRQPLSREGEEVLWKVLVQWVSKNYPRQRSVLKELVKSSKFNFFRPPRDFITVFTDEEAVDNIASCAVGNTSEALLHMYMTKDQKTYTLITMGANFRQPVEVTLGEFCEIKTVAIGNHLYVYYAIQTRENSFDEELKFSVYSTVRLTDGKELMKPGNLGRCCYVRVPMVHSMVLTKHFEEASICGDPIYNRIYLHHNFDSWTSEELFWYDCESDWWSVIDYRWKDATVETVTYFDRRLYLFRCCNIVQAYDPRAGKWETLRRSVFLHRSTDRFCGHKRKLYATCEGVREGLCGNFREKLEVYDPVAGRWREAPPTSFPRGEYCSRAGWLVSLKNKLWIFRESRITDFIYRFQRFDSLIEKWDKCRRVFSDHGNVGSIKDIVITY